LIIVKLYGGLGNQMFQYAAARRLAIVNNGLLKFDMRYFNLPVKHDYALNHFNIVEQIATGEEISHLIRIGGLVQEKSLFFDPNILKLGRDVYLEGYWANEKYFKDIESTIRQEFTVKYPLTDVNKQLAAEIKNCNSVSLHVRRGDYLDPRPNPCYLVPLDYYYEAVKRAVDQLADIHIFFFSDDPDWVQQNLKFNIPTTLIRHNGEKKNYEDLRLMSLCNHHIIANSTFSWWGSWLSDNPNKIVFASSKWYNIPGNGTHLFLESWQLI
jgi:hypothetical protein